MPAKTAADYEDELQDVLLTVMEPDEDGAGYHPVARERYVDCGIQFEVWRREHEKSDVAILDRLLPEVYGGVYDRLTGQYVGPSEKPQIVKCHPGQVELLTFKPDGKARRVLAIGTPGGGKTFAVVRKAGALACERANGIGGVVAPTGEKLTTVWRDFQDFAGPLGLIAKVRESKREIILVNNTLVQFVAAERASERLESPVASRSWDWCVVDESQMIDRAAMNQIATRGRRVGMRYVVYEAATNGQFAGFRLRLDEYRDDPESFKIVRFTGLQNPWTEVAYWESFRRQMSAREYRELIEVDLDLAPERLQYHAFKQRAVLPDGRREPANVRPLPDLRLHPDITDEVTNKRYGVPYRYLVGQDFGALVTCSVILKCFRGESAEDHWWWVLAEVTGVQMSSDRYARLLRDRIACDSSDFVVVADPHVNTADVDKSDYNLFRQEGLTIHKAKADGQIPIRHRVQMLNTLFEDANGKRRLFIADPDRCPRLYDSLRSLQTGELGQLEQVKKNLGDKTHWPCALGYGLWPFEFVRGQSNPAPGKHSDDAITKRLQQKASQRR